MSVKKFAVFSFFLLFLPIISFGAGPFDYTPLEKIPGFESQTTGDFFQYISLIYKFGLWGIGIAAILMITIGGYMYITSAGNNSSMEKAKGVITDAIVGLILALVAYLLLYIINPDLVKIKGLPTVPAKNVLSPIAPATTPGPGTQATCNGGKCAQIDPVITSNYYGVEPATLKSLLVGGEGCDKSKSSAGACGYSQTMPAIRKWCGIAGTAEQSCAAVQNDINLDINCAAKLLKEDMMRRCGTDIVQLASCYNTGKKDNCVNSQNNYCSRVSAYYSTCKK